MLKINLSVLLAERNLKISKVSKDTGISRTTLLNLGINLNQGIQLDTLNTLCVYLGVTPAQFFCYAPFEVEVEVDRATSSKFNVRLSFINAQKKCLAKTSMIANTEYEVFQLTDENEGAVPFNGKLSIMLETSTNLDDVTILKRFLNPLPPVLKKDVEQMIGMRIAECFDIKDLDEVEFKISWEKMMLS